MTGKPSIFKGKNVLVSGGSSGIGLDLAKLFLEEGAAVAVLGSNAEKLKNASLELQRNPSQRILLIQKDLADAKAPREIVEELKSKNFPVDVLINSAGFGTYGDFHKTTLSKQLDMIQVNVSSLVALTYLFIPDMIERGFGRIMNIASTAAFQAVPSEIIYAASKAFVLTFSEGLHEELKKTPVRVTCLCPGPTQTPFFSRGSFAPSAIMQARMMKSMDVARIGLAALKKGKALEITGFFNQAAACAVKWMPRQMVVKVAAQVVKVRYDHAKN